MRRTQRNGDRLNDRTGDLVADFLLFRKEMVALLDIAFRPDACLRVAIQEPDRNAYLSGSFRYRAYQHVVS